MSARLVFTDDASEPTQYEFATGHRFAMPIRDMAIAKALLSLALEELEAAGYAARHGLNIITEGALQ